MTIAIRGLTLIRPWSWAIAHAGKRIENRTWSAPWWVGRLVAIHAGRKWDAQAAEDIADMIDHRTGDGDYADMSAITERDDPPGRIVAVARLVGFIDGDGSWIPESVPPDQRDWWFGPVGWILADVLTVDPARPIECKGAQGLWRLPHAVEAEIERRLAERQKTETTT